MSENYPKYMDEAVKGSEPDCLVSRAEMIRACQAIETAPPPPPAVNNSTWPIGNYFNYFNYFSYW